MFEDFRKQAEQSSFPEDDQEEDLAARYGDGRFLGLTPFQRFIVVLWLFIMIIVIGVLFLLVTSKIYLPFLG